MNNSDQYQTLVKQLLKWQEEIAEKDRLAKKVPCYEEYPPIREFKEITLADKPTVPKLKKIPTSVSDKTSDTETILPAEGTEKLKNAEEREKRKQSAVIEKNKGNEHFKKGEFAQAIQLYSKSIELDPLNAVFPINRAMVYLKLERYSEAEKDCTLGLGIDPSNIKALWRRGIARRHLGKLVEAKQDLEKALKIEATNQAVKTELSLIVKALNDHKSSQENLKNSNEKVDSPKPTQPVPRRRLEIEEIDADDDIITPVNTKYTPKTETPKMPSNSMPTEKSIDVVDAKDTTQMPSSKTDKPAPSDQLKHASIKPKTSQPPEPLIKDTTIVKEVAVKPLPQFIPPKTTMEFERQWRTYRNDPVKLYHYFKSINPENYANIFKSSLESSYMTKILEILKSFYIESEPPSLIFDVLKYLSKVKRFDMIMMFMSPADKQTLQEVFHYLRDSDAAPTPEDLSSLAKVYKVAL
ncbi:RNA polymerase II-associated protein 3 [Basidiobolus ranarum]|uniref:RNA polymerase II-associated protein 3 n=1 Tax=Basidiobolus ranarum TaxID=34480 RepID=A0ABR2W0Z7_9FUNG